MDKVIVVSREDGGCSIVVPAPSLFDVNSRDRKELAEKGILGAILTRFVTEQDCIDGLVPAHALPGTDIIKYYGDFAPDEEVLEWIKEKDAPNGIIVDRVSIPQDRSFRNAWSLNENVVQVDMEKARDIHMDNLRLIRDEILSQLDIDYMRADEAGDIESKNEIALKKQQLRDIPQDYDLSVALTPEELKLMIPEILT